VRFAPRYSPLVHEAVRVLDDPAVPIAETCRRVGDAVVAQGLFRPSYSHLRPFVREQRDRRAAEERLRAERRAILADAAGRFLTGRFVDPNLVLDRLADARDRQRP
jgi:hypothetical protein